MADKQAQETIKKVQEFSEKVKTESLSADEVIKRFEKEYPEVK